MSAVALMDARSVAATARNKGILTPATEYADDYAVPEYHYDDTIYKNRVYNGFGNAHEESDLVYGPNIKDWPEMTALTDNILLKVCSKILDDVTTTDELIPSGETSSYRSNPLGLAEFTLSRRDPEYVGRSKKVDVIEKARRRGEDILKDNAELADVFDKIKTIEGPDDYGCLQEMIYRRFSRAQKGDPAFAILPYCIFMDGGRGQVTAAKKVLDALRLDVPVVGLVKDDSHRTRGIMFEDGREISLKDRPLLFAYAGTIQEEVHRFAIEYHRNLRGKKTVSSILDEIKGIGPRRRNALLAHFGSIDSIKKASLAELTEVEGMSEESARNVIEFFK